MGCDIHACIEYLDGDEWQYAINPIIQRDYSLFSLLANVRGVGVGVAFDNSVRGLPTDISQSTLILHTAMQGDAHSASWLTLDELKNVQQAYALWENTENDSAQKDAEVKAYLIENFPEHIDKINDIFSVDTKKYKNADLDAIIERMEMYDKNGHDTRLVFWFDN